MESEGTKKLSQASPSLASQQQPNGLLFFFVSAVHQLEQMEEEEAEAEADEAEEEEEEEGTFMKAKNCGGYKP